MRGIYVNREYSWLLFNKRVLDQASDLTNPLLERCKFLSIFASNLDEFFMVRVGSLCNESLTDPNVKENKTGLTPAKQLEGIRAVVRRHYQNRISAYIKLRGELNKAGVRILKASELTPRQSEECKSYFLAHVLPLLSMMVLDAKHPMMQFENRRHYMIYDLEREGRRMIGVTFLNPAADRLYRIGYGKKVKLVPVEELLKAFGHLGFMGYTVRGRMLMRVTRNADVDTRVDDNDVEHDFSEFMKKKIESRARMGVVRLEVDDESSPLKDFVLRLLKLDPDYCFEDPNFFDYKFLFSLGNYFPPEEAAQLRYPPFRGAIDAEIAEAPSLIDYIYGKNIFLSYPYDSMTPVVDLLDECAKDKRVLSIKITIYRLANHSRIVDALCRACERGKQVTVVIELMARFDEENNMHFAPSSTAWRTIRCIPRSSPSSSKRGKRSATSPTSARATTTSLPPSSTPTSTTSRRTPRSARTRSRSSVISRSAIPISIIRSCSSRPKRSNRASSPSSTARSRRRKRAARGRSSPR